MNAQVIDVAYASPDYFEHWHGINWRKCHEKVRKMQARIVKATQEYLKVVKPASIEA